MCLRPTTINGVTLSCAQCRRCRADRVHDLVGRCLAEATTATATLALTLTYGAGEGARAHILTYSDVQRLWKRLRSAGYSFRYIVAGEYGSRKGRAHWHAVVFFYGDPPPMPSEGRTEQMWSFWPHGFTFVQRAHEESIRYLMKYALKNTHDNSATKELRMSKKPPLGYQFFSEMAQQMVDAHLPLRGASYRFANSRKMDMRTKKKVSRTYWLRGRMKEIFLAMYVDKWREKYGTEPVYSEYLWKWHYDRIAAKEMQLDDDLFDRRLKDRRNLLQKAIDAKPKERSPYLTEVAYLALPWPLLGMAVLISDGELRLEREDRTWLLGNGASLEFPEFLEERWCSRLRAWRESRLSLCYHLDGSARGPCFQRAAF